MKNPTPVVSGRPGAPHGRPSFNEGTALEPKFFLRRIPLDCGGYDRGGAYWGHGDPLYWCGNEYDTVSMFFRARSREVAKAHVRGAAGYSHARFFN